MVIEVGAGENDQVDLATVDGWTEGANVTVEGETFRVFTVNSVTLAVDSDATIAFV